MFCYQCQETSRNSGCDTRGVCGKQESTAVLQDLLIFSMKGMAILAQLKSARDADISKEALFICDGLFATITNANFDDGRITALINESVRIKKELIAGLGDETGNLPKEALWTNSDGAVFAAKGAQVGILSTANEDVRSLRELLIYGLKGVAAYAHHAYVLGYTDDDVFRFMIDGLASTLKDLPADEMIGLVMKCGETAVKVMALLDKANTTTYGNPELTKVNIGVRDNPGILISGHDLKDMEQLLKQTEGTGVDVYTHSEMLPANYYPAFKKYSHFVGNYGNAWWKQDKEFASFNGPILMTTNCITPVKDEYKNRIFTPGMTGYPGVKHIEAGSDGSKDFSGIIELAKKCKSPVEIEKGEILGGFAHAQVFALADKVVDAVKSGAIKRFVVMAGCDGRMKSREYFTDVAKNLPADTVILTAGCAKYRYNKLQLGDIGGIPRVLDAGQCNDSYSLAVIALKLKEIFGLDDINKLPLSFDLGWYEQKAVAVLLALLYLGVKNIKLGPTVPAFLSPNVLNVLVEKFGIAPITDVKSDIESMMAGK